MRCSVVRCGVERIGGKEGRKGGSERGRGCGLLLDIRRKEGRGWGFVI